MIRILFSLLILSLHFLKTSTTPFPPHPLSSPIPPTPQLLFVHIDTSDEPASRIMEFFNIEESDTPTSRVINLEEDMRKFVPESNALTAEFLTPWIQDYLDGKLKVCTNTLLVTLTILCHFLSHHHFVVVLSLLCYPLSLLQFIFTPLTFCPLLASLPPSSLTSILRRYLLIGTTK